MDEGILTPYKYNIYPVSLNEDEAFEYEEISKNIASMVAQKKKGVNINETIREPIS